MLLGIEPSRFRVEKTKTEAVILLSDGETEKIVAPDEAYAKAVDKTGFEALLKRAGLDARPRPQPAAV
jgi:hypothetical protein